jgi:hypothetical protein
MKLEFSRQLFGKFSNLKFHENPSSASRAVTCDESNTRFSRFSLTRLETPLLVTQSSRWVRLWSVRISGLTYQTLNMKPDPFPPRCRPSAVLQWRRKTFRKFLADNEVSCYVMSFHICAGISVTPVPVPALIWTDEFLLAMIPCRWHSTDITADGRNWQRPADVTRFGTHNELWDSHSGVAGSVNVSMLRWASGVRVVCEWCATFPYIVVLAPWSFNSARKLTAWPWRRRHYSPNPVGTDRHIPA